MQYYNENAESFFEGTVKADMEEHYEKFLGYLNKKEESKNRNRENLEIVDNSEVLDRDESLLENKFKILDLGCGSGRDSKFFIEKGYQVVALDISEELAKKASEYIGQEVLVKDMREMDFEDEFSGIWACASLLHIPYNQMEEVLKKCFVAMKKDGILYTSFKYGEEDYEKNGREFTCFTEDRFKKLLEKTEFRELELSISRDVRDGRESEKWLNVILKNSKNQTH